MKNKKIIWLYENNCLYIFLSSSYLPFTFYMINKTSRRGDLFLVDMSISSNHQLDLSVNPSVTLSCQTLRYLKISSHEIFLSLVIFI